MLQLQIKEEIGREKIAVHDGGMVRSWQHTHTHFYTTMIVATTTLENLQCKETLIRLKCHFCTFTQSKANGPSPIWGAGNDKHRKNIKIR